jgi:TPR repeat protein
MRDFALGRRWLTAAAKRGNPCAEYNLGVLYNTGLGVAVDAKEAQKWFRRAVSHVGQNGTMADLARSCGSGPDAR